MLPLQPEQLNHNDDRFSSSITSVHQTNDGQQKKMIAAEMWPHQTLERIAFMVGILN